MIHHEQGCKLEKGEGYCNCKSFVISAYSCWRPGCYGTIRAARYAFRFPDEVLLQLQEKANKAGTGTITMKMLQEARKFMDTGQLDLFEGPYIQ